MESSNDPHDSLEQTVNSDASEKPCNVFRHDPLPLDEDAIRLLRLHPGAPRDPVQCSIRKVLLHQVAGTYHTLSYMWGDLDASKAIFIGGAKFLLRPNLFRCLKALRPSKSSVGIDLWVDSICIDQGREREKNHQVQQMSRIYKWSLVTHVWLGGGGPLINRFMHIASTRLNNTSTPARLEEVTEELRQSQELDFLRRALRHLLGLQYWKRLWVVQELILSPQIIVHWGSSSVAWSNLLYMCQVVAGESDSRRRVYDNSMVRSFDQYRRRATQRSFLELLRAHRHCACADSRDRVFSLLGLVPYDEGPDRLKTPIRVDYALSARQLMENVLDAYMPLSPRELESLYEDLGAALHLESREVGQLALRVSAKLVPLDMSQRNTLPFYRFFLEPDQKSKGLSLHAKPLAPADYSLWIFYDGLWLGRNIRLGLVCQDTQVSNPGSGISGSKSVETLWKAIGVLPTPDITEGDLYDLADAGSVKLLNVLSIWGPLMLQFDQVYKVEQLPGLAAAAPATIPSRISESSEMVVTMTAETLQAISTTISTIKTVDSWMSRDGGLSYLFQH